MTKTNLLRLFYIILFPFSVVYGMIVRFRNFLYDSNILTAQEFNAPILSVGNITVGGTGKTPHVEYIINLLEGKEKPAVLSRGYKRKTKGFVKASVNSTLAEIGDEPLQMKRKFTNVDVVVDKNRVKAIRRMLAEDPTLRAIVLDDAFQHRAVSPGLNILLIDYNRPLEEDYYLPAGRLREPASSRYRANIIILTKCPDDIKPIDRRLISDKLNLMPYQNLYYTRFKYGTPQPVFPEMKSVYPINEVNSKKSSVLLVTGIASPLLLKNYLSKTIHEIEQIEYPDHYAFKQSDIDNIAKRFAQMKGENKVVITTEKDAVRLINAFNIDDDLRKLMFYIPVEVEFLNDEGPTFDKQIINYVQKNKRDSYLYR
jgi:tetraacyldisaccharide 4'-kinase